MTIERLSHTQNVHTTDAKEQAAVAYGRPQRRGRDRSGFASVGDLEHGYSICRCECKKFLEELRGLNVAMSHCRYSAKELIYHQHSSDKNALYVLLDGVVKLCAPYQRGKNLARLVRLWELFGDLHLTDERSSEAWAEAFTDCEVAKIPRSSLRQAIRWRPEVALKLATLRGFQLVQHEVLLECLWHRGTKTRLARLLLLLAGGFGEGSNSEAPMQIGLRLTHQELAEMIATSRESVSTVVSELRDRKLIEMDHQRILILDFRGLAECALLPHDMCHTPQS